METFKETFSTIFYEIKVNDSKHIIMLLILFRITHFLRSKIKKSIFYSFLLPLYILFFLFFRFFSVCICSCDLYPKTRIGKGLLIYHGFGLVVHPEVVIGENCILRQGVTIGNKIGQKNILSGSPKIGNNVQFGANSCVIGDIIIGDNCIVGAGAIVTKNLKENSVIVPAKMINL
ncbi:serine acetyltransferase [Sodalis sp. dw_96]|uniref:serine acetyltransferase n=1 Tax=Sodalis sp. dw_96 TaxID=2719794 RepID=UPI001BD4C12E|nr:serine acetyltransferase [Sodalis sp. dw_96]